MAGLTVWIQQYRSSTNESKQWGMILMQKESLPNNISHAETEMTGTMLWELLHIYTFPASIIVCLSMYILYAVLHTLSTTRQISWGLQWDFFIFLPWQLSISPISCPVINASWIDVLIVAAWCQGCGRDHHAISSCMCILKGKSYNSETFKENSFPWRHSPLCLHSASRT